MLLRTGSAALPRPLRWTPAAGRGSASALIAICLAVFIASAATTILWGLAMAGMGDMPMPGGWRMSMMWMRMPGQSWPAAGGVFLGMWMVMMLAMMMPALAPVLMRYQRAPGRPRPARQVAAFGVGYFLVYGVLGVVLFLIGAALATGAMRLPLLSYLAPPAAGLALIAAGVLQITAWKASLLACCQATPASGCAAHGGMAGAWRQGVRLGLHCSLCCTASTVALLVVGIMDLRAMAGATLIITLERIAPIGGHVARLTGLALIASGLLLLAHLLA